MTESIQLNVVVDVLGSSVDGPGIKCAMNTMALVSKRQPTRT
ncbi:MAG: hypothetical protein AAGT88_00765 [Dethiobacter sp.]